MSLFPRIFELHRETQKPVFLPKDQAQMPRSWFVVDYKEYPRFPQYPLPAAQPIEKQFSIALHERRSKREFDSKKILSSQTLSDLLYWAAGEHSQTQEHVHRMYPSAGGRYPCELYLSFSGNNEIPTGVYHYHFKNHALEQILSAEGDSAIRHLPNYPFVKDAQVILFISGMYNRSLFKYKERGYRFMLLEAGILLENVHLVANTLSLSSCAIGSSIDTQVETVLELSPEEETILTHLVIGA